MERLAGLALPPLIAPVARRPSSAPATPAPANRRIADVLDDARRNAFVGRRAEQRTFEAALASAPVRVFWVHGPGGIGKTDLLLSFERVCRERGHVSVWADWGAPEQRWTPVDEPHHGLDLDGPATPGRRPVVFIDALGDSGALGDSDARGESGFPLASLLRNVPGNALVVVASRLPPGNAELETGPAMEVRLLRLSGFEPEEARAFLGRRGVPEAHHAGALALAQGYPFALALVAAGHARALGPGATLEAEPTLTYALLDRLVGPAIGTEIWDALGVAAMARVLTEPVVAAALDRPGAHATLAALRALPAVHSVPGGVRARGILRDALVAELRWRNRDRYDAVCRRLRAYYAEQARAATPETVLDALTGYAATCDVPTTWNLSPCSPRTDDAPLDLTPLRPAAPDDIADVLTAVRELEGAAPATWAARWAEAQPEGFRIARAPCGALAGFAHMIDMTERPGGLLEADPLAQTVWDAVERTSPVREDERVSVLRFWGGAPGTTGDDAATWHDPSAALWPVFAEALRHAVTFPRPAATVLTCADPELWRPVFERAGFKRLVEGQTGSAFWHDWRAVPVEAWLSWLVDGAAAAADARPGPPERLAVFSKAGFVVAVRDALRDFAQPHALARNPLLESHLAGIGGCAADRIEALRSRIRDAAEFAATTRAGARHAPALDAYYLRPSGTQAEVSERLGLSFSTFRRTLERGTAGLTETLWTWERGEAQGLAARPGVETESLSGTGSRAPVSSASVLDPAATA